MYSIFKRGADILISIIALPFMLLLTIVWVSLSILKMKVRFLQIC